MPQPHANRRRTNAAASRGEPRPAALLLLLFAMTAAAWFLGLRFGAPVSRVAVFSASLAMPQGAAQTLQEEWTREETTAAASPAPAAEPAVAEPEPEPERLTDTPDDILRMMREAEADAPNTTRAGAIVEKQYGESSATDVWENITVRNTTPSHGIDIAASVGKSASLHVTDPDAPLVLIFHTHTTECYELLDRDWYATNYITRTDDKARNMVRVGDAICEQLEKAGIAYIHDTEIHDAKYTGAYDRSRETIDEILKANPSIQVVLDVHRDAIQQQDGTRVKPVATIDGKKAAQIMIIAGCEDGKVTNFPTWEENLTFALQLQQTAETKYPGLMRPILFSARKYNMDITPCSVLLEMGSDSNTLEEAVYAGRLIGTAIAELLARYMPQTE